MSFKGGNSFLLQKTVTLNDHTDKVSKSYHPWKENMLLLVLLNLYALTQALRCAFSLCHVC